MFSLITKEEKLKPNFKTQYLQSGIKFEDITNFIHLWHTGDSKETLDNFLGLAEDEMQLFVKGDGSLKVKLDQLIENGIKQTNLLTLIGNFTEKL